MKAFLPMKKRRYLMQGNKRNNTIKSKIWKFIRTTFSSIIFLCTLFAAITLILSAYSDRFSPVEYSAFPAYMGFIFPAFVLINFCFLAYWIIRRKWQILIPLLGFLISWPAENTYYPIHFKTDVPDNAIKFLTYNVQHFDLWASHDEKHPNPIVQYILDQDADIVCLQEYAYLYVNGKVDIHPDFKEKYPYSRADDVVNVNNYKYNGLALFSKYPIIDVWRVPYISKNNGSAVFKVNVNGKIITIINNHLETNRITENDKKEYAHAINNLDDKGVKTTVVELTDIARQRLSVAFKIRANQAEVVAKEVDKASGYVIACGDFNDTPISYARHTIKGKKLRDAFADTGFGWCPTYNENKFYFRIDHILYTPNLKPYNCVVDNSVKYSDHYPMICYFTFGELRSYLNSGTFR